LQTNLDTLVLENFVLEKSQQQEVDSTKLQAIRDLPFSQDRMRESQQNLQFVMSLTCALGLISVILWYRFQSPWLSGIFLFGAASVATVSCFGAVARKWVERQFKRLTLPIRWLVTLVLLGILYYLVVTPIGFFLRLRGRDLRKDSSGSRSQWIRTPDRDVESYFRTY
jgi:hypothetical protein